MLYLRHFPSCDFVLINNQPRCDKIICLFYFLSNTTIIIFKMNLRLFLLPVILYFIIDNMIQTMKYLFRNFTSFGFLCLSEILYIYNKQIFRWNYSELHQQTRQSQRKRNWLICFKTVRVKWAHIFVSCFLCGDVTWSMSQHHGQCQGLKMGEWCCP